MYETKADSWQAKIEFKVASNVPFLCKKKFRF